MRVGDTAPEFALPDQHDEARRLSELLEVGPVVLFFYPAARTKGCAAEARAFQRHAAEFEQLGAQVVGISVDGVADQECFAQEQALDFPLLSDHEGTVSAAFGVRRPGPLPNRRVTFVIARDHTVLDRVSNEISMTAHPERALARLRGASRTGETEADV